MTNEHFTLQSARGIINGEIVARVNLYFLTLSSLIVARLIDEKGSYAEFREVRFLPGKAKG